MSSPAGVVTAQRKIYIGQGVRVRASFRSTATRELLDPGEVTIFFRDPEDLIIPVTVEHDGTGQFSGRHVVEVSGLWYWRIESAPPGEAAKEGWFRVEPTAF